MTIAIAERRVDIERIEDRRPTNKQMDAVYVLSPLPHIVDCVMADLERQRYRRTFLIWTAGLAPIVAARQLDVSAYSLTSPLYAVLRPDLQVRLDKSAMARQQIVKASVLNIDYYPRESHLITFRDPWSFPTLFHPACNHLVAQHMDDLAQKVDQS